MILQEVSEYAPQKLKEMEEVFAALKRSSNNKNARLGLLRVLKDFTRIPEIVLFVENDFNAGIVTVYNTPKIKNIISSFIELFKSRQTQISPNELSKLTTVKESPDAIKRIYISIGKPLIKYLTPQEMVAVVLHELGHVYAASTALPSNFFKILQNGLRLSLGVRPTLHGLGLVEMPILHLYFLYSLITMVFIYGIMFTEHVGEYRADNFALKYGYGDELMSALNKFPKNEKTPKTMVEKAKMYLKNFFTLIKQICIPRERDVYYHQDGEKRIKNLEDQIFDEYKKLYPNQKEIIDLLRADYKTQEATSQ